MPQSYYDIDAILAEDELVPCTTLFEFSHLADLDPDGIHHRQQDPHNEDNNEYGESSAYLPENSRIKIPLWAVEKWATLGFVRLQLPRHYGRRARERYDADPGDANLRCVLQNLGAVMQPHVNYFVKETHFLAFSHIFHLVFNCLCSCEENAMNYSFCLGGDWST